MQSKPFFSKPINPESWPPLAAVSEDRVAVMGHDCRAFLYQGSNDYLQNYFDEAQRSLGNEWLNLLTKRQKYFNSPNVKNICLFVPNKATSISHLYPYPIPDGGTVIWRRLRELRTLDSQVLLAFDDPSLARTERELLWARVDSHWSTTGCLYAVNEVLQALGLETFTIEINANLQVVAGDLSERWHGYYIQEERCDGSVSALENISPKLAFDNGKAKPGMGVQGRRVEWVFPEAKYDLRLCVVGNSFSGPGLTKGEMVWWFARLFSSVTFIHSGGIPTDLVEKVKPDLLVFQGLERFLKVVPLDNFQLQTLDELYKGSPVSSKTGSQETSNRANFQEPNACERKFS